MISSEHPDQHQVPPYQGSKPLRHHKSRPNWRLPQAEPGFKIATTDSLRRFASECKFKRRRVYGPLSYLGDPIALQCFVILSTTKPERTKLQRITNIKWGLPSLADVKWRHVQIKQNYWCISYRFCLQYCKDFECIKDFLVQKFPMFSVQSLPCWWVFFTQSNGFALWSAKLKTEEIWSQNR